ncbi:hypothetical protein NBRC116583_21890 [Arenicella sp. 4NH20-0111]|uniref:PqqD family protein n=1 Tax=Arenicella sp. 4NH20-0111 TaxID=3127648 RepID=UPI003108A44C
MTIQEFQQSMHTYYKLPETIIFTELDDEAVLLDLTSGSYFGLNHVGVRLIKSIVDGMSAEDAIVSITNHYQAAPDTVKSDIANLLNEMLEKNLIVIS